jgi:O-antigen/teichoic acid export membrane protein
LALTTRQLESETQAARLGWRPLRDAVSQFARNALGQASPLLVGRAITTLVTFGLPLALVRLLTPERFGEYKQFFLILQTALLIGQLGLTQSLYFFLPRGGAQRGAYVVQASLALGVLGTVLAALLYFQAPLLEAWLNSPALGDARLPLALSVLAMLASAPLESALIGDQRLRGAAATYVLSDGGRAIGLVLAAMLFGGDAIFWAAAATAWLRAFGLYLLLSRRLLPAARPCMATWRAQAAFAVPIAFAGVLHVAQRNFAQYAVSAEYEPATFALFTVASFHLNVLNLVFTPISDVLTVRLGKLVGSGAHETSGNVAHQEWQDAVSRLSAALLPATCAAFVFGPILIPVLFTTSYAAAVPLFLVASLELPLWILPTDSLLWAAGRTRWLFLANVLRLAITAFGVVVGLAVLGLVGAIVGGLIAELVTRGAMLIRGYGVLNVRFRQVIPWKTVGRILLAAGLAMLPSALVVLAPWPSIIQLGVGIPIYGVAYVALLALVNWRSRLWPISSPIPTGTTSTSTSTRAGR